MDTPSFDIDFVAHRMTSLGRRFRLDALASTPSLLSLTLAGILLVAR